nr:uncharacterized protein LOC109150699 isoform X4 [Ipomoea batatas]
MARSYGSRRSKRRATGHPYAPSTPSSAGTSRAATVSSRFKRRSYRDALSSAVRDALGAAAAGVASRVAARRRPAQWWSHRGPPTQRPPAISDEDGDSDEDFHTAPHDPVVHHREKPLRTARMGGDGSLPKIKVRGVPRELLRVVTDLNQCQRQGVCDIGMGGLLGFRVNEISSRLGYWLVSNFDPSLMRLKLANGSFISVTNEDVAGVLGLPNGLVPIVERDSQVVSTELREWRDKVNKRRGRITVKALATLLLNLRDGGVWFQRHFCIVVVTSLVASVSNGYVNQQIVHMFRDVNKIKDLDWCGYLLRSLVAAHGFWKQDKTSKFTRPLTFLTLLYVDRLVVGARDIPRSIPMLDGWTTELLKTREAREVASQGFGHGMVDAPPCETNMPTMFVSALGGALHPQHALRPSAVLPMRGAPSHMETTTTDIPSFSLGLTQDFVETANARGTASARDVITPSPQGSAREIDNIEALECAEDAAIQETTTTDMPSFSLGLTQDFAETANARGTASARDVITPSPQGFAREFDNATTQLLAAVTRVVDMVHQQSKLAQDDPNSVRLAEVARLINQVTQTGIDDPPRNTSVDPQRIDDPPRNTGVDPQTSIPSYSQQDDAFWLDLDNIEALERVEKAAIRATTMSDMPSFSLGLTQDVAKTANTGGMASPRGVTTPSSQIDIHAQQSRPIQQPRSQCLAPQRNDIQDPKGKRPLMQDPRPFCMYFSPTLGYPSMPLPAIYIVWM